MWPSWVNTNYCTSSQLFALFYCAVSNCVACDYDLNHLFVRPAGKSSEWAERGFANTWFQSFLSPEAHLSSDTRARISWSGIYDCRGYHKWSKWIEIWSWSLGRCGSRLVPLWWRSLTAQIDWGWYFGGNRTRCPAVGITIFDVENVRFFNEPFLCHLIIFISYQCVTLLTIPRFEEVNTPGKSYRTTLGKNSWQNICICRLLDKSLDSDWG